MIHLLVSLSFAQSTLHIQSDAEAADVCVAGTPLVLSGDLAITGVSDISGLWCITEVGGRLRMW